MNHNFKQSTVLKRWVDLRSQEGWRRVNKIILYLRIITFALCFALVWSIFYNESRVMPALIGITLGWVVAEKNALRARKKTWPLLEKIIDWSLVEKKLSDATDSNLRHPEANPREL